MMLLAVVGVLAIVAVIGMVSMDGEHSAEAAVGDQFTVGELIYEVIADGEVEVTDTISTSISGDLEIPSTVSDGSITYSVMSIGSNAFYDCRGLTSITIPEGVTSIGNYAFHVCTGLTSITIPSTVTSNGQYAFYNCTGLTEIVVDPDNQNYSSSNGVLFNRNGTEIILYPKGRTGDYSIPEGVTSIGNYAFHVCTGLTSITIPSTVTSIGQYAFYNCTGLTSITIPEGVTSIGNYAFYVCTGLTSVTISSTVTSIGDHAFRNCSRLTSITIPEGVTSIGDSVFLYCYALTSITIPSTVTSIGDSAFRDCSRLTSITIPEGVTSIGDRAFSDCSSLTSVTFESATAPTFDSDSFSTGTTINVYTLGWNPEAALENAIGSSTTIVWANPAYSNLIFVSDPISNGTLTYGHFLYIYFNGDPYETVFVAHGSDFKSIRFSYGLFVTNQTWHIENDPDSPIMDLEGLVVTHDYYLYNFYGFNPNPSGGVGE